MIKSYEKTIQWADVHYAFTQLYISIEILITAARIQQKRTLLQEKVKQEKVKENIASKKKQMVDLYLPNVKNKLNNNI